MLTVAAPSHAPRSGRLGYVVPAVALSLLLALLGWHLITLLSTARVIIVYPYGLDYGEGIVWQQMRNILNGSGYAPLGVYPAIVYHYPPVFHLVSGLSARIFGTDPLATGRSVSLLSTLASAMLIGWLSAGAIRRESRATAALCGLTAGLFYLACEPTVDWASLMRVDMLACAFSLMGLALAIAAIDRPRLIVGAAICFVLAVYTKQTSVAAPAAALIGLAIVRPRRAYALLGLCLALGLAALLLLELTTDDGFLRHILLYNLNRVRPEMISALVYPLRRHLVLIALALAGSVMLQRRIYELWAHRADHRIEIGGATMLLVYLAIKTAMLLMIMKSGANTNYMIEWFCAVSIAAGVALATPIRHALGGILDGRSILLSVAILLGLCAQTWALPLWRLDIEGAHIETCKMAPLVALVAASDRPVIADEMTLLLRAGRDVAWEPAIVAELSSVGRYDEAAFARLIRAHRFGLFITEGDASLALFRDRYNPALVAAIDQAYPHRRNINGYTLHADDRTEQQLGPDKLAPRCA